MHRLQCYECAHIELRSRSSLPVSYTGAEFERRTSTCAALSRKRWECGIEQWQAESFDARSRLNQFEGHCRGRAFGALRIISQCCKSHQTDTSRGVGTALVLVASSTVFSGSFLLGCAGFQYTILRLSTIHLAERPSLQISRRINAAMRTIAHTSKRPSGSCWSTDTVVWSASGQQANFLLAVHLSTRNALLAPPLVTKKTM